MQNAIEWPACVMRSIECAHLLVITAVKCVRVRLTEEIPRLSSVVDIDIDCFIFYCV